MGETSSFRRFMRAQSRWQRAFAKKHPILNIVLIVLVLALLWCGMKSDGWISLVAWGICIFCGLVVVAICVLANVGSAKAERDWITRKGNTPAVEDAAYRSDRISS
jgi:cell division protein FtsW (lipid II flippase)